LINKITAYKVQIPISVHSQEGILEKKSSLFAFSIHISGIKEYIRALKTLQYNSIGHIKLMPLVDKHE
jgi:hypothetical protein